MENKTEQLVLEYYEVSELLKSVTFQLGTLYKVHEENEVYDYVQGLFKKAEKFLADHTTEGSRVVVTMDGLISFADQEHIQKYNLKAVLRLIEQRKALMQRRGAIRRQIYFEGRRLFNLLNPANESER